MSDAQTQIDQLVKSNDIVLFMKGNASFPMCGFSGRAIQILKACGVDTKTVKSRSSTARPEAPSLPCPSHLRVALCFLACAFWHADARNVVKRCLFRLFLH
jgi:hypothetical protein